MGETLIVIIIVIVLIAMIMGIFYYMRFKVKFSENDFKGGEIKVKKIDENGNITNEYKLLLFLYAITGNVRKEGDILKLYTEKIPGDVYNIKEKVDEYILNTSEYVSIKQVGFGKEELRSIMKRKGTTLYLNSRDYNSINIESIYEIEYNISNPNNKKNKIYLYHETHPNQLLNIICNKFSLDNFGQTDSGYFGKGIYFEKAFTDNYFRGISGNIYPKESVYVSSSKPKPKPKPKHQYSEHKFDPYIWPKQKGSAITDESHVGFKLICEVDYDNYALPTYPVRIYTNEIPNIEFLATRYNNVIRKPSLLNKISRVMSENQNKSLPSVSIIDNKLFSNDWFNGKLYIAGMPKEKVDVLVVPSNVSDGYLCVPYEFHQKASLWSEIFSSLRMIYPDTFNRGLSENSNEMAQRKNIINVVLSCIIIFIVTLDSRNLDSDNKKEILKKSVNENKLYILDCFNKLKFEKNFNEFLDSLIDWFIRHEEKEQQLMKIYKQYVNESDGKDYFLFEAVEFLMYDFNTGFDGLIKQLPIETYTQYTTEAVGELVVNDLSLIRPKYIVVYTTTSPKLESIKYDLKWDFGNKGSEISSIKILGQGTYNIAFQATLNNGNLYCLRFGKPNDRRMWYNETSYKVGTLLAKNNDTGFVKPYHVQKLFISRYNQCVLYINPVLRKIENIKDEIPKVAICLIKALRFMHANNMFYVDFFNVDNFMFDNDTNILISDVDLYTNYDFLTLKELIHTYHVSRDNQNTIINIINKGYNLNKYDVIRGIYNIRYYCAKLTKILHNEQATAEYHQYITTCLMARLFMYLLIEKKNNEENEENEENEWNDANKIPIQINENVAKNMNALNSLNPVDVIKTTNMLDADYEEIMSSCGDDMYNKSYASLPTDWYITLK